jgi:dimeric dUTPase (all-alpha-NTP-PPase superfamily)
MITHETIIKMQCDLNYYTAGAVWKKGVTNKGRQIDWDRCIYMECCEAIDSLNWKHWKNLETPDDLSNLRIEVVDVFHFLLSKLIATKGVEATEVYLKDYLISTVENTNIPQSIEKLIELSVTHNDNAIANLKAFSNILGVIDMSVRELYTLYVGKNILNKFRQDNGYKTGTYIKNWALAADKEDVIEDNEVMQRIMGNTSNPEDIYLKLNNYYNLVKVLK